MCDYDKETKRVMPCSLNVEFKTQQRSKCGGITSNSLCGTSFRNDKWNEVKSLSVQHINEFSYKISSVHRVKLSTTPFLSHPIWSNIELPVLQVLLVIFSKRIVLQNIDDLTAYILHKRLHQNSQHINKDLISFSNQNAG